VRPEEARERLQGDAHAAESLGRVFEHLKLNEALPETVTLGASLKVNTKTETIEGNQAASALERRSDRAPYAVPALAAV